VQGNRLKRSTKKMEDEKRLRRIRQPVEVIEALWQGKTACHRQQTRRVLSPRKSEEEKRGSPSIRPWKQKATDRERESWTGQGWAEQGGKSRSAGIRELKDRL